MVRSLLPESGLDDDDDADDHDHDDHDADKKHDDDAFSRAVAGVDLRRFCDCWR